MAAYSPRVRPGLPVSAPVGWDALDDVRPGDFTVRTSAAARWPTEWAAELPEPQALPADLVAEGHTIPVARVAAMHEGKRRKRAREAAATDNRLVRSPQAADSSTGCVAGAWLPFCRPRARSPHDDDPQTIAWLDQEDAHTAQVIRTHGWAVQYVSGDEPATSRLRLHRRACSASGIPNWSSSASVRRRARLLNGRGLVVDGRDLAGEVLHYDDGAARVITVEVVPNPAEIRLLGQPLLPAPDEFSVPASADLGAPTAGSSRGTRGTRAIRLPRAGTARMSRRQADSPRADDAAPAHHDEAVTHGGPCHLGGVRVTKIHRRPGRAEIDGDFASSSSALLNKPARAAERRTPAARRGMASMLKELSAHPEGLS